MNTNPPQSTCCTCGHSWETGKNGWHICSEKLQADLKEANAKLAAAEDDAKALADALIVCRHAPCCDWHTAIDCPPGMCDCGRDEALDAHEARVNPATGKDGA
jgi:hypothetical protein